MNTDNLALRGCLETKRIVIAQVLLRGKWQLLDVLDGLDVIWTDVHCLKFVAIKRYVMIYVLYNLVKSLALQRAHLVATHALFVRIPNHVYVFRFV